ncbi:hypothetical protein AB0E27_32045 [Streptomyces sparsogenes]|uniref:hypothetical protein n=1 Tax=Streptomyces sparsogenes TaxID=67365 RepID=UPI003405E43A
MREHHWMAGGTMPKPTQELGKEADLVMVRLDRPGLSPATDVAASIVAGGHVGNVGRGRRGPRGARSTEEG